MRAQHSCTCMTLTLSRGYVNKRIGKISRKRPEGGIGAGVRSQESGVRNQETGFRDQEAHGRDHDSGGWPIDSIGSLGVAAPVGGAEADGREAKGEGRGQD